MTHSVAMGTVLSIQGLNKSFTDRSGDLETLRQVSFAVAEGEFYAIVGPSGCGKSTLLNIIAGLEPEDDGSIRFSDVSGEHGVRLDQDAINPSVSTVGSRLGRIAYMPQKDLLLPWRTVQDNAALGLELTGTPRTEARARAGDLMGRFGLDGFAGFYPATLSGGMRQRAAFLRTVLTERNLMLLDEPFGALDALTRRSMQEWLLDVWSEMQRTVVLITHDVEEAIFLSDRVAVMSPRPGTIIAEHNVDLPRPRRAEMVTDPAFVDTRRAILADLRAGLKRVDHVPE